jgi:hypothetical protein
MTNRRPGFEHSTTNRRRRARRLGFRLMATGDNEQERGVGRPRETISLNPRLIV